MAWTRSNLALALLLAAISAISAGCWTMKDWQDILKDTQEYKNWCDRPDRCELTHGRVPGNDECRAFFPLRWLMEKHLVDNNVTHDDAYAKKIIINATFCVPENYLATKTQDTTTATRAGESTYQLPVSGDSPGGNDSNEIVKPEDTNHLNWIIPAIGLVSVLIVFGSIHIHRSTKKPGPHSPNNSNGETAKDIEEAV